MARARPAAIRLLRCLKPTLVALSLLSAALPAWPEPNAFFTRLSRKDGLPHDTVQAVLVSRAGFAWLGTSDGLCRYDGRSCTVYRHDSAGDRERGPALVRKAVERNPHHLQVAFHALWADHLRRGEFDAAYQAALRFSDALYWRPVMRACCLGHLGRRSEAMRDVGELLRFKPDFARRGCTLISRLLRFPDLLDRVVDGLAKAGIALD